ncbi:hypothetical protein L1264_10975, partial [Pseudoalteromonas sp. APAL1]|uniref:hypothetical protein n=1 Tax=Pseudoalteromonas sp. APAL1 TaxID=2908883 RepID=UPI001F3CA66F
FLYFIPMRLIKWSILRQQNLVDNKAKISLFSCARQLILHCSTFCIHAVVNQKFLTQVATGLIPQND